MGVMNGRGCQPQVLGTYILTIVAATTYESWDDAPLVAPNLGDFKTLCQSCEGLAVRKTMTNDQKKHPGPF